MTTLLSHNSPFRFQLRAVFSVLLVLGVNENLQAQNDSPVGTWDCVISGARNGLAYLTFSGDINGGTFAGYEVLVPKSVPSPRASLIPGMVAGLGSNGLGVRPPVAETAGNTAGPYGYFPVSGPCGFDSKG